MAPGATKEVHGDSLRCLTRCTACSIGGSQDARYGIDRRRGHRAQVGREGDPIGLGDELHELAEMGEADRGAAVEMH